MENVNNGMERTNTPLTYNTEKEISYDHTEKVFAFVKNIKDQYSVMEEKSKSEADKYLFREIEHLILHKKNEALYDNLKEMSANDRSSCLNELIEFENSKKIIN